MKRLTDPVRVLYKIPLWLVMVCFFLETGVAVAREKVQPVTEVRYSDFGEVPRREDYQVAVLTLALDKTLATHGPYQLKRIRTGFTHRRIRREISIGKIINVYCASWRNYGPDESHLTDPSIRSNIPIQKGLIGYRNLIIRKEDLKKFSEIRNEHELKQLVAGQAQEWVDSKIYSANGYEVNNEGKSTNLLSMLRAKRIDYIPMQLVDPPTSLSSPALGDSLTIAPRPLIFYSLPFVFYVSINNPDLAERIDMGLTLAKEDGSFDELFEHSFSAELAAIRKEKEHFFVLNNPLLPKGLQIKPHFQQ